jgi:uncharacterized protein (DUF2147 family)
MGGHHDAELRMILPFLLAAAGASQAAAAAPAPALATTAAPAVSAGQIRGVWSNRRGTIHIRTEPCGDAICGAVVKADAKAKADAAKGQKAPLIGTRIFIDFRPTADGRWKGKVYAPDLGQTFAGTIRVVGGNTLQGRGCAIAGLICKTSTYVRVR